MNVRQVPRSALDLWLRAVRAPVDVASQVIPNGDTGPRNAVTLFIDRADAAVRDAAGKVLGDEELRDDARRRRKAADERERAIELRVDAERKKRRADAELAQRQREADARRAQAEREADQRETEIDKKRQSRKQQVRETVAKQERAIEQVRENKLQSADKEAKRERLRVLEEETKALDRETEALTANDEAERLRTAAAKAKQSRKRTG